MINAPLQALPPWPAAATSWPLLHLPAPLGLQG